MNILSIVRQKLQEMIQEMEHGNLVYNVIGESGPDHDKIYTVEVLVNGLRYGVGQGSNKKTAQQEAAKHAIKRLTLDNSEDNVWKDYTDDIKRS